jgi:hypothetical protein
VAAVSSGPWFHPPLCKFKKKNLTSEYSVIKRGDPIHPLQSLLRTKDQCKKSSIHFRNLFTKYPICYDINLQFIRHSPLRSLSVRVLNWNNIHTSRFPMLPVTPSYLISGLAISYGIHRYTIFYTTMLFDSSKGAVFFLGALFEMHPFRNKPLHTSLIRSYVLK